MPDARAGSGHGSHVQVRGNGAAPRRPRGHRRGHGCLHGVPLPDRDRRPRDRAAQPPWSTPQALPPWATGCSCSRPRTARWPPWISGTGATQDPGHRIRAAAASGDRRPPRAAPRPPPASSLLAPEGARPPIGRPPPGSRRPAPSIASRRWLREPLPHHDFGRRHPRPSSRRSPVRPCPPMPTLPTPSSPAGCSPRTLTCATGGAPAGRPRRRSRPRSRGRPGLERVAPVEGANVHLRHGRRATPSTTASASRAVSTASRASAASAHLVRRLAPGEWAPIRLGRPALVRDERGPGRLLRRRERGA